MAIHVTEQLRTFLLSILRGLGAGVLYDLLRAVRLRHPRLTAPLDLLYCQAVGLAVFLFVLRQSDGQLRGFILLGGLVTVGWRLHALQGQVRAAQAERDQYARQVENVQQENETLRSDIAEGPTEEKMKELAREELGMIDSNSYLFLDRSN